MRVNLKFNFKKSVRKEFDACFGDNVERQTCQNGGKIY